MFEAQGQQFKMGRMWSTDKQGKGTKQYEEAGCRRRVWKAG